MYVRTNELGFIEPVTSAIFSIASLKNLFGIGKKKAARAANVEQNKGLFTEMFPPGTDFSSTLDLTPALSGYGKRKGAKTLREDYEKMFAHKDSWLVKNGVASPEDYAAYSVLKAIEEGVAFCDPKNRNSKALLYKRCPTLNGENVFVAMEKMQAPPPAPALPAPPPPVEVTPQPGLIDRIATALAQQQQTPAAPAAILPQYVTPIAPAPASKPQAPVEAPRGGVPAWAMWGIPAALVVTGAMFMMTRAPAPRRRRARR